LAYAKRKVPTMESNKVSKEQFTVDGNMLVMSEVTDTTLLEYKDKIKTLYPDMELRIYTDKDKQTKTKMVFKNQGMEIPKEILEASKKTIASISTESNKKSVYSLALDSFKVLARATFLESVKDSLGIPKGVGGITPEGRGKKKYLEYGGTYQEDGTPNNDAVLPKHLFGMEVRNVSLESIINYERTSKK
jgi:hypothetical protein